MINWQEWVVGVLVVLCIARIIYGIFLFFRHTRENKNPCDSCVVAVKLNFLVFSPTCPQSLNPLYSMTIRYGKKVPDK